MNERMIREHNLDYNEKYEVLELLGRGSMGKVDRVKVRDGKEGGSAFFPTDDNGATGGTDADRRSLMERRKHKVTYAVKTFQLDRICDDDNEDETSKKIEELGNEIDLLKSSDHPNIVKAYEVYSYRHQLHVVMEYCSGGNLYSRLPYTEKQVAKIIGRLCSAVRYMHKHGFVHRDLNFENILFESTDDDAEIKLINFGLSKKFSAEQTRGSKGFLKKGKKNNVMYEKVGSLQTMAPEVIQKEVGYTTQADMWSIGVITYMLFSEGISPFVSSTTNPYGTTKGYQEMINRTLNAEYHFGNTEIWSPLSKESISFIEQLIVKDPDCRMTAKDSLEHSWLSKQFHPSDRLPTTKTEGWVRVNLMHYHNSSALKKIALNVIAHRSSAKDILELRKLFDQYDKKNSGVISFAEFESALKEYNYSYRETKELFQGIDMNLNGYINYTEFIAASLEAHGDIEEERIAEAFDHLDSDDSGFITLENLKEFLERDSLVDEQEILEIIETYDRNNDGKISWEEFSKMFQKDRNDWIQNIKQEFPGVCGNNVYYGIEALPPPDELGRDDANNDGVEEFGNWINQVGNPYAKSISSRYQHQGLQQNELHDTTFEGCSGII